MKPPLFLGALSTIQTQNVLQNNKNSNRVKIPLWFICWLFFLLGVNIGLFIIFVLKF